MSTWVQLFIVVLFIALFAYWDMRPVKLSKEDQELLASLKEDKHYHDDCE